MRGLSLVQMKCDKILYLIIKFEGEMPKDVHQMFKDDMMQYIDMISIADDDADINEMPRLDSTAVHTNKDQQEVEKLDDLTFRIAQDMVKETQQKESSDEKKFHQFPPYYYWRSPYYGYGYTYVGKGNTSAPNNVDGIMGLLSDVLAQAKAQHNHQISNMVEPVLTHGNHDIKTIGQLLHHLAHIKDINCRPISDGYKCSFIIRK